MTLNLHLLSTSNIYFNLYILFLLRLQYFTHRSSPGLFASCWVCQYNTGPIKAVGIAQPVVGGFRNFAQPSKVLSRHDQRTPQLILALNTHIFLRWILKVNECSFLKHSRHASAPPSIPFLMWQMVTQTRTKAMYRDVKKVGKSC